MGEKELPRYWSDQLPEGLATANQLSRLRRRLAPNQQPLALLVYGRREETTPAYRISDAVPLPPLTTAQRAAAKRRRTVSTCCRVCGVDVGRPLGGGNHLPDVCDACRDDHHWQQMRDRRGEHRQEASQWAADVLQDPNCYLVTIDLIDVQQPEQLSTVKRHAAARIGFVSSQGVEPTWYNVIPQEKPKRLKDLPPGVHPGTGLVAPDGKDRERYRGVPIAEVAQRISDDLQGKRIIGWHEWSVRTLGDDLRHTILGYSRRSQQEGTGWEYLGPRCLRVGIGDQLGKRYDQWVGALRRSQEGFGWQYVNHPCPSLPPGDRVMWMLDQVKAMAASPVRGTCESAVTYTTG